MHTHPPLPTLPVEASPAQPVSRPTWYRKYWQWSSDSGCGERMIWCRSVSISSYTTYTSCKGAAGLGGFQPWF